MYSQIDLREPGLSWELLSGAAWQCPWLGPVLDHLADPLLLDQTRSLLKPEVSGAKFWLWGVVEHAGGPLGVGPLGEGYKHDILRPHGHTTPSTLPTQVQVHTLVPRHPPTPARESPLCGAGPSVPTQHTRSHLGQALAAELSPRPSFRGRAGCSVPA